MLKITVSPGDFIMVGEDVKIVFCGGEKTKIPLAIDAPKDIPIIRNTAKEIRDFENVDFTKEHYVESYDTEQHRKIKSMPKKKKSRIVMNDQALARTEKLK